MNMLEFLIGAGIGAGGMIVKDVITGNGKQAQDANKRQLDELYAENEKLRTRYKEAERKVEDLMAENQKLKRNYNAKDNSVDDLEDELETAKQTIKKLQQQNDDLMRKVQEYKTACESYEIEIAQLKQ